jgi:hypothetical protein
VLDESISDKAHGKILDGEGWAPRLNGC